VAHRRHSVEAMSRVSRAYISLTTTHSPSYALKHSAAAAAAAADLRTCSVAAQLQQLRAVTALD